MNYSLFVKLEVVATGEVRVGYWSDDALLPLQHMGDRLCAAGAAGLMKRLLENTLIVVLELQLEAYDS
jgi:hypothetical protein